MSGGRTPADEPRPDRLEAPEELGAALTRVAEWAAHYRARLPELPVLARVEPGDVAGALPTAPPERGESLEAVLADLDRTLLPGITHWNHPGFLAYFSSSSATPGILAELVTAVLGVNAMLWRTSPAATELEERTTEWLRQAVGLPDSFRGVIQDTASSGSFTALLAAREAVGLEVRARGLAARPELPALVLYVSEQAHSSLEKAAIAAGLGQAGVRRVPTDAAFRMRPSALAEAMAEDRAAGRRPLMVCATVGTTSTASVDPVDGVAEVVEGTGTWLHVDAAYAGPAAMLPELRDRFAGWERADSVVINPHKWMATPMDCSVLLFRDGAPFRASLALTPEYLRAEEGVTNLMDYGLPLGRRFRALKLWFLFRMWGVDGLRAMLRSHLRMAAAFADRVRTDPDLELAAPPCFSTVCFRVRAGGGAARDAAEADRRGRGVLDAVNGEGRVFLSHTSLEGRYVLRLSVGSAHTRPADVEAAYEAVRRALDGAAAADEDEM